MTRLGLLLLVIIVQPGLSQSYNWRQGSEATLSVQKKDSTLSIEVLTNPELTKSHEMSFFIQDRSTQDIIRRTIPPENPGHYRLSIEAPAVNRLGISLRYGIGIDMYYGYRDVQLGPQPSGERLYPLTFRGTLRQDTPAYIQTLGFGILAMVLILTLISVTAVLRHLRQQSVPG